MTDVRIAQFPTGFKLEFSTTNSAFFEAGYMYEVLRILKDNVIPNLPNTLEVRTGVKRDGPIHDHYGNLVGRWYFE